MTDFHTKLERIRADRRSGSTVLVIRTIRLLRHQLRDSQTRLSVAVIRRALDSCASAFPVMALFDNLRRGAHHIIDQGHGNWPGELSAFLQSFERSTDKDLHAAAAHFDKAITTRTRFLTLSASRGVLHALRAAAARQSLDILVCESRPACEGVVMARKLAQSGIHCHVVTDAAGGGLVESVDAIVLGADWIHPRGFINKTGSRMLSDLGCLYNKTTYVIGDKKRFNTRLPPGWSLLRGPMHVQGVFEWIDWNASHRLVTEEGVAKPTRKGA